MFITCRDISFKGNYYFFENKSAGEKVKSAICPQRSYNTNLRQSIVQSTVQSIVQSRVQLYNDPQSSLMPRPSFQFFPWRAWFAKIRHLTPAWCGHRNTMTSFQSAHANTQLKSIYGVSGVTCHNEPGPPITSGRSDGVKATN